MLSHVTATLALALGLAQAAPQVVERDSPIPGYGLVDLSWEVQVVEGQPPQILTGTVQDVHKQILAINPNFRFNPPKDRSALLASNNITARADVQGRSFDKLICCDDFYVGAGADTLDIRDGVSYLDGVSGKPSNGPGPGNCGRVSCSYDAAIFWCNDVSNFSLPPSLTLHHTGPARSLPQARWMIPLHYK
jgi:hypothetical protein